MNTKAVGHHVPLVHYASQQLRNTVLTTTLTLAGDESRRRQNPQRQCARRCCRPAWKPHTMTRIWAGHRGECMQQTATASTCIAAADELRVLREDVYQLSLALVPPLPAEYDSHGSGHLTSHRKKGAGPRLIS